MKRNFRYDSFDFDDIKLIKLEAEGHELEILKGAMETLKNTKYITVDYGPEKVVMKE